MFGLTKHDVFYVLKCGFCKIVVSHGDFVKLIVNWNKHLVCLICGFYMSV